MVRAILDGRKTQTRRMMKPQPSHDSELQVGFFEPTNTDRNGMQYPGKSVFGCWNDEDGWKCPFCPPGDRLWVRESHAIYVDAFTCREKGDEVILYRADASAYWNMTPHQHIEAEFNPIRDEADYEPKWRPSIHMPRWASRITLEITGVRVERLNDISEEDCYHEGLERETGAMGLQHFKLYGDLERLNQWTRDAKWSFQSLWESINGEGSWALNPYVWVIEFKVV